MRLRVLLSQILVFTRENSLSFFLFTIPTGCYNLTNRLVMSFLTEFLTLFEMIDWLFVVEIEVQK